jgi:large subunit ribosomal protein L32
MACPQKKISKARKNKRRAHHARTEVSLARCKRCGAACRPHAVCSNCGHYRGNPVIDLEG